MDRGDPHGGDVLLFDSEGDNIPKLMETDAMYRRLNKFTDFPNIVHCVSGNKFAEFLIKHENEAFMKFPDGKPIFGQ